MPEASKVDQQYKKRVLLLIAAIFIAYLGFKAWHISVSLEVWKNQELETPVQGAAK